ncbi:hypothetical protein ACRAWD_26965 [Caulobacter segnis]
MNITGIPGLDDGLFGRVAASAPASSSSSRSRRSSSYPGGDRAAGHQRPTDLRPGGVRRLGRHRPARPGPADDHRPGGDLHGAVDALHVVAHHPDPPFRQSAGGVPRDGPLSGGEVYAWLVLVLGYMQCVWPLDRGSRRSAVLRKLGPRSTSTYRPTTRASRSCRTRCSRRWIRTTRLIVFQGLHPRRRPAGPSSSFRACGGLPGTSPRQQQARQGRQSEQCDPAERRAASCCIFDADHVATRAFLQLTVGWFQADPWLA